LRKKKEKQKKSLNYNVAVTDMVFNSTIWVFKCKLRALENHMLPLTIGINSLKIQIHYIGKRKIKSIA